LGGHSGVVQVNILLHDLQGENKVNIVPNKIKIKYVTTFKE
jgi:hypothetical protein